MSNRELIIDLAKETLEQTTDSALKITEDKNDLYEQGFIKGYISAINRTNALLKKSNVINIEDFIRLNELIAENLETINKIEVK